MRPPSLKLIATIVMVLLSGCGGSTTAPSRISLKIGYASPSILHGPMWIAKEAGYFEQRGMDVDLQYIGPGQPIISAVLQGDVALATDAAPTIVAAQLQGAPLKILASYVHYAIPAFVAQPSIKSPRELTGGKRFAVTQFGTSSVFLVRLD